MDPGILWRRECITVWPAPLSGTGHRSCLTWVRN